MGWGFLPYLDGKTDITSVCAVHEFYCQSTVKIPILNILRFANVIPNTPGMTRKTFFRCIKYRLQLNINSRALKGGITPLHAGYHGDIQERRRPTIFLFLTHYYVTMVTCMHNVCMQRCNSSLTPCGRV